MVMYTMSLQTISSSKGSDRQFLHWNPTGEKGKAAKVATDRTLWVPAVNNHGGFGRWPFLEITDPCIAKNGIRSFLNLPYVGREL